MSNLETRVGHVSKSWALALARWALGIIFLFFGLGKFPKVGGFANALAEQFAKTWLPQPLVLAFGHVLPFLEVSLGILLLLGVFRNATLVGTGLLLLALIFGQVLQGEIQGVFFDTGYLFITACLLFCADNDRFVIHPRHRP